MSAHSYDDLLAITDGDAAAKDPDVLHLRALVSAMPAELCIDDDDLGECP